MNTPGTTHTTHATLQASDFVRKWRTGSAAAELNERAGAQAHFIDLCRVLGVIEPGDPERYCFERGVTKTGTASTRTDGFADVWLRGHFAWEYKAPGRSLEGALKQLMMYALPLENPPLLVVSDRHSIEVHTHFTGTPSERHVFQLEDTTRPDVQQRLRALWLEPDSFKPKRSTRDITEEAARTFAGTAERLRASGVAPAQVSHFLTQCLFCFFAEDVGLLPARLFERLVGITISPELMRAQLGKLFEAMREGGLFGVDAVPWFNGGLFQHIDVPALVAQDVAALKAASNLNWSAIDPSIFGTLFERGLDPSKRSQLGAHYTDPATIMRLVEPVVQRPLLAEWAGHKLKVAAGLRALALLEGGGEFTFQRRPFTAERSHEHGFHQRSDVLLTREVRAQLRALVRVQAALEERAEDGWFDELPVRLGSFREQPNLILGQLEHGGVLEEMAVEVTDFVMTKRAALRHDGKQFLKTFGEELWLVDGGFGDVAENRLRQQAGILGKEAKNDAIEEAGDAEIAPLREVHFRAGLGVGQFHALTLLERLRDLGNGRGKGFRDLRGGALRLEVTRIEEQGTEHAPVFRAVEMGVGKLMHHLHRAVEIRADDVAVKIADHEQRRIEQRFAVAEQLLARFIKVLVLALVFPTEAVLFPNVSPALLWFASLFIEGQKARLLDDALLKTKEILAARIGFDWRLVMKHPAQVGEVLLIRGRFLARVARPLLFEFGWRHGKRNAAVMTGTPTDDNASMPEWGSKKAIRSARALK